MSQISQYVKLKAQITELQARAEEARHREIETVVAEIHEKIDEYGLTARDLGFAIPARRGRPPKNKSSGGAMYRDPATGSVWSGRGRRPNWMAGKDNDHFLVKE